MPIKTPTKSLTPMLMICLIAGAVLAVLSPYGTSYLSTPMRFAYWMGLCLAGGIGAAIAEFIAHMKKWSLSAWKMAFFQSLTSTLVVTAFVMLINIKIIGQFALTDFASVIFYVWVVAMAITSVGALLRKRNETDVQRPALYERLSPKLRNGDIYALCAEDHYVRVITSKGDDLILMRLSDAIKETAPLKGLSPHRSWWVSEAGVDKATKSKLVLHSGQTAPVSRTGLKHVRAAGWI